MQSRGTTLTENQKKNCRDFIEKIKFSIFFFKNQHDLFFYQLFPRQYSLSKSKIFCLRWLLIKLHLLKGKVCVKLSKKKSPFHILGQDCTTGYSGRPFCTGKGGGFLFSIQPFNSFPLMLPDIYLVFNLQDEVI